MECTGVNGHGTQPLRPRDERTMIHERRRWWCWWQQTKVRKKKTKLTRIEHAHEKLYLRTLNSCVLWQRVPILELLFIYLFIHRKVRRTEMRICCPKCQTSLCGRLHHPALRRFICSLLSTFAWCQERIPCGLLACNSKCNTSSALFQHNSPKIGSEKPTCITVSIQTIIVSSFDDVI